MSHSLSLIIVLESKAIAARGKQEPTDRYLGSPRQPLSRESVREIQETANHLLSAGLKAAAA